MSDNTKTPAPLSSSQIKFLKGLAHHLKPVVQIGKEGVTDSVIQAVTTELGHHELIKVKIGQNSGAEKKDTASTLTRQIQCHLVQIIGKTIILYKRNPKRDKERRIRLPKS